MPGAAERTHRCRTNPPLPNEPGARQPPVRRLGCRKVQTAGGRHAEPHPCPGRRCRQHGAEPCQGLSPAGRLRDRRPDEPQHRGLWRPAGTGAARLPAVSGFRAGAARDAAGCGLDQQLPGHARGLCHARHGRRLPRVHGKAAGHHRGRCRGGRGQGRGHAAQAGAGLYPAGPPGLGKAGRDRPHAGQAAGDADEPQPAILRPGLGLAQEPDGEPDPHRRLRRALCGRDVPADPRPPGPGPRHRRQARGRDQGCRTTATCTSSSTTARSAGTRPAGGR